MAVRMMSAPNANSSDSKIQLAKRTQTAPPLSRSVAISTSRNAVRIASRDPAAQVTGQIARG
jgi:hypothetical protein